MHKFLIICILVTIVSLGYVHQQVELLKVGYIINENNERLDRLLDVNGILRYNVVKNKLPHNVYSRLLAADQDFEIAYTPEVVNIYPRPAIEQLVSYGRNKREVDVLTYLGITVEAEALTTE